jgi:serine protease Do
MNTTLASSLAEAIAEILQRLERSLVVLNNSHHGEGAGVIWRRDREGNGLILTNDHIVAHGHSLHATLQDGDVLPAQVLTRAPEIDLALLRIEAKNLSTALIADSRNLRVGQLVFAVGHPWGQRNYVTAGLISSLAKMQVRERRGEIEIIRSDARLAPGNSGGPLVNASGAVVGINTMIVGGDQGIALPSHVASTFVEEAVNQKP